jgi:hypothetical protein
MARPATVPGTPMPSAESRDLVGSGLPSGPRKISGVVAAGDVLAALRRMDDHEAAAADVAGARIRHGQGKTGCHRSIDRIAAAPQHVGADACRDFLLRNHHAVLGDNGMNGVGGGRRVKAAALLSARRQPARDKEHEASEYPAPFDPEEAHQNAAAALAKIRKGYRSRECYMVSDTVGKTRLCDSAGIFWAW